VNSRHPATETIEALLDAAIVRTESYAPWAVLRAHLIGEPGSVIVKWLRDNPTDVRRDPRQVATERAALEFLAGLGFRLAPRVLASDLAAGILVLEDLSPRVALDTVLREGGVPLAGPGMRAFTRAYADLHVATAGRFDDYYAHRARYGPVEPTTGRAHPCGPRWPVTRGELAGLGLALTSPAERDLAAVHHELTEPGPFLVLTNGDSNPNNFLVDGEDGRLIDFEFAGYRHALSTLAWMYVPGPAWITVTDPIAGELTALYRRRVAPSIPEAGDDRRFGAGLAATCLAHAFERLNRFPVVDARAPGDNSRVQLVATLESAAAVAAGRYGFPRLAGWTRRVATFLRKRWSDADVDLSGFRSFAPR
jgi:Phosphotransferase enzyme family